MKIRLLKHMENLEKLKFPALDIGGQNYIVWAVEARNFLSAEGLESTIHPNFKPPAGEPRQNESQPDQEARKAAAKAVCLLLRHLPNILKANYLEERNPSVIWNSLKLRFNTDRKQTMLPLLNDE